VGVFAYKGEWKQIIFWHLAFCTNQRFFPFEHLPEKKKKNILLKKKLDAARIKRVMSVGMQKECGGMHRGR
jgi:hypothetical protein